MLTEILNSIATVDQELPLANYYRDKDGTPTLGDERSEEYHLCRFLVNEVNYLYHRDVPEDELDKNAKAQAIRDIASDLEDHADTITRIIRHLRRKAEFVAGASTRDPDAPRGPTYFLSCSWHKKSTDERGTKVYGAYYAKEAVDKLRQRLTTADSDVEIKTDILVLHDVGPSLDCEEPKLPPI